MAIAGTIEAVEVHPEGCRLILTGRLYRQEEGRLVDTPAGQPSLLIADPTWIPAVGMGIWGGSDSVIIEAKPRRLYKRLGYIWLQEDWTGAL